MWTQEQTDQLRGYLAAGKTAGQIEVIFRGAFSRNAIISRAHRKGIPMNAPNHPTSGRKGGKKTAAKAKAIRQNPIVPRPKKPTPPNPWKARPAHAAPSLRLTLMELNNNDCHYPEGDRPPFLYCGNPVEVQHVGAEEERAMSYCSAHCRIVYQPVSPRRI